MTAYLNSEHFSIPPKIKRYNISGKSIAIVTFSWRGKAHVDQSTECQDFTAYWPTPTKVDDIKSLTLTVADGVSTRSRSRKGAECACTALGQVFSGASTSILNSNQLKDYFTDARDKFVILCQEDNEQNKTGHKNKDDTQDIKTSSQTLVDGYLTEYATTALLLYLNSEGYWAAIVGDGAIYKISSRPDDKVAAQLLTENIREGFVNEVRPLTNTEWQRGFAESSPGITEYKDSVGFCLMTDGLSESIGDPNLYFSAIWPKLKQCLDDPVALEEYATAYCNYWEEHKFSDDDKTLVAVFYNL